MTTEFAVICVPDPASLPEAPAPQRTQSRDSRRAQVIEATLNCMAERGFSRTTVTDVAARAGISHGLVLFHFGSKENLLAETLDHLADEYRRNWQAALAKAGPRPEARIRALIDADFTPEICTPVKLAAWCAYWGESQSRPMYQARCGANDDHYNAILTDLCAQMNREYGYDLHPQRTARLLRITTEGTWLEMMTLESPYPVAEALETVLLAARALFPRHFA